MNLNFAANIWSVGIPLGGTFFMWLLLRAATYKENNPNGLITLVCILIFLTVFSFIKLIGIG